MTLKMTPAQVVETSVIVNNNSSFQNYTNPDDHTQQTTFWQCSEVVRNFSEILVISYGYEKSHTFDLGKVGRFTL